MRIPLLRSRFRLIFGAGLLLSTPASAVSIDWVPIGNPGNACDPQLDGCYGSVAFPYNIDKYEVTNEQYVAFLNAVTKSDPNGLYNPSMDPLDPYGGITQSGVDGSFVYTIEPGREKWPVTFVSVYDAMRFANWLQNGQPTGGQGPTTTEGGAYTITPDGISANSITRNPGASIFLPTEDEWYKAAYYSPGGVYYDYPTGSDTQTTCEAPPGGSNSANCGGAVGSYEPVGSYPGSASPYGTYDQGGNVWEFTETILDPENRLMRGGDLFNPSVQFSSSFRQFWPHQGELGGEGFRVAMIPEPGTGLLVIAGLLGLAGWRRDACTTPRGSCD